MKKSKVICVVLFSFLLLVAACTKTPTQTSRWYTQDQVDIGKPLYDMHCAGCHGENGEGAPNSDKPLPNGSYPPQPLNGSGHSWHHSLSNLTETIEKGGRHPGATMPAFGEVLDYEQRKAVVAAFQNFWNDRTYRGWLSRGGLK